MIMVGVMETATPAALLVAAIFTLVNLVRYLRGRDWNGALTIASAWVIGTLTVWVFAESSIGASYVPPIGTDQPIGTMGFADFIFVGLFLAAGAQTVNEFFKSRDNTRSTAKPELVSGNTTTILPTGSTVVVDAPPS